MSVSESPKSSLPKTSSPNFSVERRALLDAAAQAALHYLDGEETRPVAPSFEALEALDGFREPLPESSANAASVLELLTSRAAPATMSKTAGRHFGFVNGGCLPAALAAAWQVSAWDQNASSYVQSPAAATLEEVALGWVRELLALPEGTGGAVVTGATMANLTALLAARQAVLGRLGWNAAEDGLFGAPEIRVVVGEEVHASVLKALGMIGLGRKRLTRIPVDGQGRMRADRLPALDARTILILQAGNVNTGAFDPASEIIPRARKAGTWVHVDGAFGLWVRASEAMRHLAEGFELADSWATDAHKWPNVGYDCGLALLRQPEILREAISVRASYLALGGRREPSDYNPELSRRARGVELWAALKSLGRSGIAEIVETTSRHARRFAEGLRAAGYEILNDVAINQVLVSFGSAEKTLATIGKIQQDGTCWCGSTLWQGKTAMRISVSSWATTDEDVERSLQAMLRAAAQE